MGYIVVHEEVDQLGQVLPVLDEQQEGHLGVDELPRDSVEVDLELDLILLRRIPARLKLIKVRQRSSAVSLMA